MLPLCLYKNVYGSTKAKQIDFLAFRCTTNAPNCGCNNGWYKFVPPFFSRHLFILWQNRDSAKLPTLPSHCRQTLKGPVLCIPGIAIPGTHRIRLTWVLPLADTPQVEDFRGTLGFPHLQRCIPIWGMAVWYACPGNPFCTIPGVCICKQVDLDLNFPAQGFLRCTFPGFPHLQLSCWTHAGIANATTTFCFQPEKSASF